MQYLKDKSTEKPKKVVPKAQRESIRRMLEISEKGNLLYKSNKSIGNVTYIFYSLLSSTVLIHCSIFTFFRCSIYCFRYKAYFKTLSIFSIDNPKMYVCVFNRGCVRMEIQRNIYLKFN